MSDKIKMYFLGTSSSTPTKNRNLSSLLINYKGNNYLFDCPENVQQQIMKVSESILKIKNIFITHFHGDHFFGLLGLLATMQLNQRTEDLNIFLPFGFSKDIKQYIASSKIIFSFKINLKEVKSSFSYTFDNINISCVKLNHSVLTFGYVFKVLDKIGKFDKKKALSLNIPEGPFFSKLQNGEKIKIGNKFIFPKDVIDYNYKKIGKKICYLTDTFVLNKVPPKVLNADILIHESSFISEHKLRAKETLHSVAQDVSLFAKKADVKKLYLTHISPRYKDVLVIEKEAKKFFKNSFVAKDLDLIEISDY
ncbi:MAG: ribonuclease Z [Candidatus ainarchaeum sp.]|nr:ribonuclease Z [Candidatus ainarchaeum sp.]MDD3975639.1 ribonuclease Z [Candidatus ainarchaeum sp.]